MGTPHALVQWLFGLAILSSCSLIMAMDFADPDLWGHVQYGREILATGTIPRTATWTFTSVGTPWINHENLAELAMAAAYDNIGILGLTFGKLLIGWALIGTLWWNARSQGVHPFVTALICLTVACMLKFHWHYRPQIIGYLMYAIMAVCLNQSMRPKESQSIRFEWLLALIPLAAVWANTHGSFVAGICVSAAFLGIQAITVLASNWRSATNLRDLPWKTVFGLLGVASSVWMATLFNPYGMDLHLWLLNALEVPRPEIEDWEATPLLSASPEVIGFWVVITSMLFVVSNTSLKDWAKWIVLALVIWQSATHIRHLPLLAITWASWFSTDLNTVWESFRDDVRQRLATIKSQSISPNVRWNSKLPTALTSIFLSLWLVAVGCLLWPKIRTLNVPHSRYPVQAFRFLAENRLEGRTVVTFNWAQYAIGFFAHEQLNSTVGIDGRFRTCYPQEVIDVYFDFFFGENYEGKRYRSQNSEPISKDRALTFHDPELFVISRLQQPTLSTMNDHSEDWVRIYQDELAEIWGRRDFLASQYSDVMLASSENANRPETANGVTPWPAFLDNSQNPTEPDSEQTATAILSNDNIRHRAMKSSNEITMSTT
ncbi:hypothetical protein [Thalassoglobus neptunius]|uniref:hypothetical protein n=1 Tax=Thalassoglobus neptunius TaxID=1938619 RepID=UPI0011B4490D|nr:hypothetical protein [Thalassoglobus neptunius]